MLRHPSLVPYVASSVAGAHNLSHVARSRILDSIYLDNTFGREGYDFPTQEVAQRWTIDIIRQLPSHVRVYIAVDNLGKEALLSRIGEALKERICVTLERFRLLPLLGLGYDDSDFLQWFTVDRSESRIFAVRRFEVSRERLATLNRAHAAIGIVPSGWIGDRGPVFHPPHVFRVPYSLHSSTPELKACLDAFQPRAVVATSDRSLHALEALDTLARGRLRSAGPREDGDAVPRGAAPAKEDPMLPLAFVRHHARGDSAAMQLAKDRAKRLAKGLHLRMRRSRKGRKRNPLSIRPNPLADDSPKMDSSSIAVSPLNSSSSSSSCSSPSQCASTSRGDIETGGRVYAAARFLMRQEDCGGLPLAFSQSGDVLLPARWQPLGSSVREPCPSPPSTQREGGGTSFTQTCSLLEALGENENVSDVDDDAAPPNESFATAALLEELQESQRDDDDENSLDRQVDLSFQQSRRRRPPKRERPPDSAAPLNLKRSRPVARTALPWKR